MRIGVESGGKRLHGPLGSKPATLALISGAVSSSGGSTAENGTVALNDATGNEGMMGLLVVLGVCSSSSIEELFAKGVAQDVGIHVADSVRKYTPRKEENDIVRRCLEEWLCTNHWAVFVGGLWRWRIRPHLRVCVVLNSVSVSARDKEIQ